MDESSLCKPRVSPPPNSDLAFKHAKSDQSNASNLDQMRDMNFSPDNLIPLAYYH